MRLENKVSIITGAGSGLGRAMALRFGQEGARVVIVDIQGEASEETLSLLKAQGSDGVSIQTDVSSDDQVRSMVEKAMAHHGRIDILINNAAYQRGGPLLETPLEAWDRMFDVNIKGYFLTCRHVIPHMVAAGSGAVLNVGSISALNGRYHGIGAYGATKAAVEHLTKSLCLTYRGKNIRVNCLVPGYADTPMLRKTQPPDVPLKTPVPEVRVGRPEEYASVAAFLVSDEASYVNGAALVVDGGLLA